MKQFEKLTMAMLDLSNAEHTTARDSALLVAWEGWRGCGEDIQKRMEVGSVSSDISQPSLEAFVRASQPLQTWPSVSESIENSKAVLRILKTVVTWTRSPDYRPDIDAPTPTQAAVLDALDRLSHNIPEVAAAIVSDLAEYSTLPYLATFENQPTMPNSSRQLPVQKITYIALSKAVMPKSLSLFLQHASTVEIFTSGAAEQLLRVSRRLLSFGVILMDLAGVCDSFEPEIRMPTFV